ncbi:MULTISPECIES: hypothetical protein [Enterococcus]|jgi:hypothetical protein|uniref:Uncharacterized protein n=1 Tax=Enterococcus faecium TaxID=1352 RepID=A0A242BDT4_ENTFC|nr:MULTISPECIES: hypothetical protein [Enterococcus]MBF0015909.1 hypothetical protein [Enterococcus casseliflavus]MDQ6112788.1 hypothetical protein [Enterococcus gallinarum]OTN93663.1 hypothetical protein A5810_001539 [Enterococcus faecium]
MKTLKQVLNVRKIDCQVETDVAFYRGNAKDLLKKISQRELNLHVINLKLERLSGEKSWDIETVGNERTSNCNQIVN